MQTPRVPVMFRVWRAKPRDVFALFPTLPGSVGRFWECQSYAHVGQHSSADLPMCIHGSRPATPEESAPLARELSAIGYEWREVRRVSQKMNEERRQ